MSEPIAQSARWRWWWPAIVMMAIIYVGSTDLGAMPYQSRILEPFLRWIGLGEATIHGFILALRKLAHLTEYALLAIFLWRAWRGRPAFLPPVKWPWREALVPLLISGGYALLDEFHQWFVPSRSASLADVLIDVAGAIIGLALLWFWHRARLARSHG